MSGYHPRIAQVTGYQYNAQASEDPEELREAIEKGRELPPPPRKGSYRPTPLRWPFIVSLIILLCCAIGLITYAHLAMPGSDATAQIVSPTATQAPARIRRAEATFSPSSTAADPSSSGLGGTTSGLGGTTSGLGGTTSAVLFGAQRVEGTSTAGSPNNTPSPSTSLFTTTSDGRVITGAFIVSQTPFTSTVTTTSTFVSTGSTVVNSTVTFTSDQLSTPPIFTTTFNNSVTVTHTNTLTSTVTRTNTLNGTEESPTTIVTEEPSTEVGPTTATVTPPPVTQGVIGSSVVEVTSAITFTGTSVGTSEFITYGPTTIFITYGPTVIDTPPQSNPRKVDPVTNVVAVTGGGQTDILVATAAPQTLIFNQGEHVETHVETPIQTVVAQAGGTPTPIVIVITPTIEAQGVTDPGSIQTVVQTPPPVTFETVVDGTTMLMTTQPPPITNVVTLAGNTVAQGGFKSVFTVFTDINGTPTSLLVTVTPSGTALITITTEIGGSLTTFVSTGAPVTQLTTISGTLTTLVSTPSPSTFTSTRPKSTSLSTTISTPTPAVTPNNSTPPGSKKEFNLQPGDYFVATFLPTFLAVMLVLPLRVIDLNAKLYQPFHALAQPGGATGTNSLTLQYNGIKGFITPVVTLAEGQPVPFITTLMVLSSSLLAPLATEALGLKLHGQCTLLSARGCALALGVSIAPAFALIGVIAFIIALLVTLLFLLRRYETGVYSNPWNLAGIASLAAAAEVRIRQKSELMMNEAMGKKQFTLGYYQNQADDDEYGIVLGDDAGASLAGPGRRDYDDDDDDHVLDDSEQAREAETRDVPFTALTYTWRILFILALIGLLIFVVYYHVTAGQLEASNTSFRHWIQANGFGVRFVFAGLGVIITFCWTSLFLSVALMTPFQAMEKRSQSPERSVLVTRPTNEFYGIWMALKQRQPYLFVVALMTIFAEFLPILLANVPLTISQIQDSSVICSRLTIVILSLMLITLFFSFFIHWPRLPVDPRTIAGAMYYVTDSYMLHDFGGMALLNRQDKDMRIKHLGKRYYYGLLVGRSGRRRMAVDADASLTNSVDTAYRGHRMDHSLVPAQDSDPIPHPPFRPHPQPAFVGGSFGEFPVYQHYDPVSPDNVRIGEAPVGRHQLPTPDVGGPAFSGSTFHQPPPPSSLEPLHEAPEDGDLGGPSAYNAYQLGQRLQNQPPAPSGPAPRGPPPPPPGFARRYEDLPPGDMGPQGALL